MAGKNSSKAWVMDLSDFVPGFSDMVDEGNYLAEISAAEEKTQDKGNAIKVSFKIKEGAFAGKTVNATLYILDGDFKGSDGHAQATKSNWYNLLVSLGVKPGKLDFRKVASKIVGRSIGIRVEHNPSKDGKKTYANIADYLPASSIAELEGDDEDDSTDASEEVVEKVSKAKKASKKKKAAPEPEPEDSDDSEDSSVEEDSSDDSEDDEDDSFDLDDLA